MKLVSNVTLCSKGPLQISDYVGRLQYSLPHYGSIAFIPSEYNSYTDLDYRNFDIAVHIDADEAMRRYFRNQEFDKVVNLDEYARAVRRRWMGWTLPVAAGISSRLSVTGTGDDERKYQQAEEEVRHSARWFAQRDLLRTPRNQENPLETN